MRKDVQQLDFEKSVVELDRQIEELSHMSSKGNLDILQEISNLQQKRDKILDQIYGKLTPWQKVQIARHPERPHTLDLIKGLVDDFIALGGDRLFAEDAAIIGGIGRFKGEAVMVMGQEKGNDLDSRLKHNFGMPRPEGYRKAQRLMKLADQFNLPIITFVDTSGAYPGVGAEERGQAEAIARSMEVCLSVSVPIISIIVGEGGSGGAIAIAVANKVLMLEHAIYSVISPEGCASILWRSADMKETAAAAQKLTAQDLLKLKIIDEIIKEPLGGAHRDPQKTIASVGEAIEKNLQALSKLSGSALKRHRRQKFLEMGKDLA